MSKDDIKPGQQYMIIKDTYIYAGKPCPVGQTVTIDSVNLDEGFLTIKGDSFYEGKLEARIIDLFLSKAILCESQKTSYRSRLDLIDDC